MSACDSTDDTLRPFFAAVIGPRLHAAIARLEHCSEDRARRQLNRVRRRRSYQALIDLQELPLEVRRDVGFNRDF